MNEKNPKKLQMILWLVLAAVAIGIGGYVIGLRMGADKGSTEAETTTEAVAVTEEKTEAATEAVTEAAKEDTEEEKADKASAGDAELLYATVSSGASWPVDKGYEYQYDIKIQNNSDEEYKNWKVEVAGFDGAKIDNSWNAKYEIKGDKLIITPESHNGTVGAHSAVGDLGVQVIFDSEADGKNVAKGADLYINDKLAADAGAAERVAEEGAKKVVNSDTNTKSTVKTESGTPYANHGKLSVKGTDIVDKNGEKYQLRGVSTHGLAWFPEYVNKDAFQTLRDDWGANLIRLAMYTDEGGGYCTDGDKTKLKKLVSDGVDYATELGMYVIIDWHVLHDLDPNKYIEESKKFFDEMSSRYRDNDNIIYEICNEPNGGTEWGDIKKYAEVIIPIIRKNDKDAIIIVGTPTWSQDVDLAAKDPIDGDNIMYAVHFYAATHKDNIRSKVTTALDAGLPIFVSEFSICDASGNGGIDYDSAAEWMDLINGRGMSYASWSLCNKAETSALIGSDCSKTSGWDKSELTETGNWLRMTISGEE